MSTCTRLLFVCQSGWSYGPRPIVDLMPMFSLLLIPVLQFIITYLPLLNVKPEITTTSTIETTASVTKNKHPRKIKVSPAAVAGRPIDSSVSTSIPDASPSVGFSWGLGLGLLAWIAMVLFIGGLFIAVAVQYIGAFAYNQRDWNAKTCFEVVFIMGLYILPLIGDYIYFLPLYLKQSSRC